MRFKLVLKALFIAMVPTSVSGATDSTGVRAKFGLQNP